jgi:hypothetical protein
MDTVVSTPGTNKATEELHLTPWGKIRCRLFEDEAIFFALDAVSKAKDLKDPYGYFFKIAYNYSSDKRIRLNNKRFELLSQAYHMPQDAKWVFKEGEINLKGEKVSYKTKSKVTCDQYNPEKEHYGKLSNEKLHDQQQRFAIAEEKRKLFWERQDQTLFDSKPCSVPEIKDNLPF